MSEAVGRLADYWGRTNVFFLRFFPSERGGYAEAPEKLARQLCQGRAVLTAASGQSAAPVRLRRAPQAARAEPGQSVAPASAGPRQGHRSGLTAGRGQSPAVSCAGFRWAPPGALRAHGGAVGGRFVSEVTLAAAQLTLEPH